MSSLERVPETLTEAPGRPEPEPGIDAVGPNMAHMLLFLCITVLFLLAGEVASPIVMQRLHVYGDQSMRVYAGRLRHDARWLVANQAVSYAVIVCVATTIFRGIWHRDFRVGLHWRIEAARENLGRLLLLGLGCGFGIALLGSVLPMPKDPPILGDMMQSTVGAWMMFVFGVTGAPLFEEMLFRGFLLPAFLNGFRWLSLKGDISPRAVRWVGIPFSVLFTSVPFALVHAPQLSHAWAPVLLIGLVSMVLCAVRLRLDSLASSTVVHAAYNFTLFAGILVQTGGFRHLDRLAH